MQKFKILHIDSDFGWRGGQQQAFYLHEGLIKRGYESCFICQPGSKMESKLKTQNLNYFSISIKGELDIFAGKHIAAICKKHGFNILHLHDAHALATGLWTKLFEPGLKLIGVRRVDNHIRKNFFSKFKYNSSKMDKHIAISNEIKRVMAEDGIIEEKINVIKSGVDTKKFSHITKSSFLHDKYAIPKNAFIIGSIAAISDHKDYPNLLKAASIVISQTENVYFIALGDGPDEDKILNMAKDLKIDTRFIFTGFQKDVGNHLKNFDIFVLASKNEGLGTSVMDAMAAQICCICTNAGGIPELIDNNENGILVKKEDPQELAKSILQLYGDDDLRNLLAVNAFNKSQNFSIEKTIEKNIELYEKMFC